MKDVLSRVSIPGRVWDLLWADDEFFRDISSHKKATSSGKFPRCDQWCDETGFHMAFALAGYSPEDVTVVTKGCQLFISGSANKVDIPNHTAEVSEGEEYPPKPPRQGVQQGIIVRGIARRNFKTKYFINSSFDLSRARSFMRNGLLEIVVPRRSEAEELIVKIEEK